jgi:hypothetical protein
VYKLNTIAVNFDYLVAASVITLRIGFPPFASKSLVDLSLSKGRSWFDKLTTNGVRHIYFSLSVVPIIGVIDYCENPVRTDL